MFTQGNYLLLLGFMDCDTQKSDMTEFIHLYSGFSHINRHKQMHTYTYSTY